MAAILSLKNNIRFGPSFTEISSTGSSYDRCPSTHGSLYRYNPGAGEPHCESDLPGPPAPAPWYCIESVKHGCCCILTSTSSFITTALLAWLVFLLPTTVLMNSAILITVMLWTLCFSWNHKIDWDNLIEIYFYFIKRNIASLHMSSPVPVSVIARLQKLINIGKIGRVSV